MWTRPTEAPPFPASLPPSRASDRLSSELTPFGKLFRDDLRAALSPTGRLVGDSQEPQKALESPRRETSGAWRDEGVFLEERPDRNTRRCSA